MSIYIERFNNLNKEETATSLISNWEKALYWSSTIISFTFNIIPRFIISGLIAIVAFIPITLPVHLISSLVNRFSDSGMPTVLNVKGEVPCSDGKTYDITLDEILNDEGPNPNSYHRFLRGDIEEISVRYSEKTKEARFRTPMPGLDFFYVKINKPDNSKNYPSPIKALFVNNIGNIANECPQIAKEIAEESSALEENRLGI